MLEDVEVAMAQHLIAEGVPDLAPAEAALDGQRRAIAAGDTTGFLEADEGFHLLLVQLAGNSAATDAARRAWLHVNRARYLAPLDRGSMTAALADHEDILRALRSSDVDGVRWAIRRHLDEPLQRLLDSVGQQHPEALTA